MSYSNTITSTDGLPNRTIAQKRTLNNVPASGNFSEIISPMMQNVDPSKVLESAEKGIFPTQNSANSSGATPIIEMLGKATESIAGNVLHKAKEALTTAVKGKDLTPDEIREAMLRKDLQSNNKTQVKKSAPVGKTESGQYKSGKYSFGMQDTRKISQDTNRPLAEKQAISAKKPTIGMSQNQFKTQAKMRSQASPKSMQFSLDSADFSLARKVVASSSNKSSQVASKASTQGRASSFSNKNFDTDFSVKDALSSNNKGAELNSNTIGALTAKFESGSEGIKAIGYDRNGGTSYGKYQISSRAGTMSQFISYLEGAAPDIAVKLKSAGPANTGGRRGKMPEVWKKIAQEDPERFEALQDSFIKVHHFEPTVEQIANLTGIDFKKLPNAMQEVLFSTAVQHGPSGAIKIVQRALNYINKQHLDALKNGIGSHIVDAGKALISKIYDARSTQFKSSTPQIQVAARNRLHNEKLEAIALLKS